jgi:hypothetical protein
MATPHSCFRLVAVAWILVGLWVEPLWAAEESEPADLWGIVQATGTFSAAVARIPRIGANLLANPGLEEGDGGPLLWSAMPTQEGETLRWADDVAHTGQRSLEIASPARSTAVRRRPDGPPAKEGKGEVVSPLLTKEGPGEVNEEHRLLIWRQHLAGLPTPGRLALSGWIKTEGVEQGAALCLQLRGPGRPLPPGLGGRGAAPRRGSALPAPTRRSLYAAHGTGQRCRSRWLCPLALRRVG